jgi:hypothetical protein
MMRDKKNNGSVVMRNAPSRTVPIRGTQASVPLQIALTRQIGYQGLCTVLHARMSEAARRAEPSEVIERSDRSDSIPQSVPPQAPPPGPADRIRHSTSVEMQVQRAQTMRPSDTAPYFIYELDADRSTFSQLASHYGVGIPQIAAANPGARASALRMGQKLQIPAVNLPSEALPHGPPAPEMIQSTTTHPVPVRWNNRSARDNLIGHVVRGTEVGSVGALVYVATGALSNIARGVLEELCALGRSNGEVAGFVPLTNLRSLLVGPSSADVNLLARMIWGEQRSQGLSAMAAAAWIVRNRAAAGWGSYSQIMTRAQFHGIANPADVVGLSGRDLTRWTEAQSIAQEVVDGTRSDATGGALYFGNDVAGANIVSRMRACSAHQRSFTYGNITGTNFYYSNGDYTATACTVP